MNQILQAEVTEHTGAEAGAIAVGGGGLVLRRTSEGWQKVLDGGPTGNGNDLYGADVTDDGKRVWFVGASGAIGEYGVGTGNLEDYSAPMDVTDNFNDVSITGDAGEANVYVAGDSGKMYFSFENGRGGHLGVRHARQRLRHQRGGLLRHLRGPHRRRLQRRVGLRGA